MAFWFILQLFLLIFLLLAAVIGLTLLYFKIDVMPLVPEIKMADVSILISLGNLLAMRTTWLVLKTTSATSILFRVFGAYSMTRIFYKYSNLPTLSLFHNFTWRVNTALLAIFTYRDNTLYTVYSSSTLNCRIYAILSADDSASSFFSCHIESVYITPGHKI